jgi:hypothetical protein
MYFKDDKVHNFVYNGYPELLIMQIILIYISYIISFKLWLTSVVTVTSFSPCLFWSFMPHG